jgi:ketosteroid isomerase-like protein
VSEENLAAVSRFNEAFNGRDLDRMAGEIDEDCEFYPMRAQLEDKAYVGRKGLEEMLADFDEDWEYVRVEVDELRDRDDFVVVLCRLQARGLTSRVDLEVPIGFVCRFAGGRLVYMRTYSDQTDALGAAGLRRPRRRPAPGPA